MKIVGLTCLPFGYQVTRFTDLVPPPDCLHATSSDQKGSGWSSRAFRATSVRFSDFLLKNMQLHLFAGQSGARGAC